jgi:hypothetical protein
MENGLIRFGNLKAGEFWRRIFQIVLFNTPAEKSIHK